MECRTRLGLSIFLFGVLVVAVLVLIRQVIPPVHVLPSEDSPITPEIPDELLGRYETRYVDLMPYGDFKNVSKKVKAKMVDASGNSL
jgi:hypothetical protein